MPMMDDDEDMKDMTPKVTTVNKLYYDNTNDIYFSNGCSDGYRIKFRNFQLRISREIGKTAVHSEPL